MLQVEHRIVVTNSCFEQPFRIIGCRWSDDFDSGSMKEPGLRAGGMEWPSLNSSTRGTTNNHWHRHARAPVHLIGHIYDLIETTGDKVDELHFCDGPHSHQGRTDGRADNYIFSHWCIDDTLRTKLFKQTSADFERTAIGS